MSETRTGTVALVVGCRGKDVSLLDSLSDEREITILETAVSGGKERPLDILYRLREELKREEEEFADYVEELISRPECRPEILEHGIQWFKSRLKIELYQKSELEATKVIAEFAFSLFKKEPHRKEFVLAGPTAQVRVRVIELQANKQTSAA